MGRGVLRGLRDLDLAGRREQRDAWLLGGQGEAAIGGGAERMPEERVELSWGCPRRILSPLRLPFRHSGRWGESQELNQRYQASAPSVGHSLLGRSLYHESPTAVPRWPV